MVRVYVDEYDKVAAIVRGDGPDEFGLFKCQQHLFAWCSAAYVLKRQRDEARDVLREVVTCPDCLGMGWRPTTEVEGKPVGTVECDCRVQARQLLGLPPRPYVYEEAGQ